MERRGVVVELTIAANAPPVDLAFRASARVADGPETDLGPVFFPRGVRSQVAFRVAQWLRADWAGRRFTIVLRPDVRASPPTGAGAVFGGRVVLDDVPVAPRPRPLPGEVELDDD
jgi:hypothetical protein